MKPLDIIIDNKEYEYITDVTYNNKNYVAFKDEKYIYIKEFIFNNELKLFDIDDILYEKLKGMMNL